TTQIQRTVRPQLLGRVLSNVYGGVAVAAAAGYLAGGPVLRATSPRTSFVIVGCGGLMGTAACAILLRRAGRSPRCTFCAVRALASVDLRPAGALPDHLARRRPRGQEHPPQCGHDRASEVFERHPDARGPLQL